MGRVAINGRRAGSPIAPDPLPSVDENGTVVNEVVEVIEPTIRGIGSPLA